MKRPVELTDLLRYHFLSSPTFSPDSKKICFSLHQADRENNRYISNIWIYDLEKEDLRQVTSSGREKFFIWKADSRTLLFASERDEVKKNETKLYSICLDGGEALPVCTIGRSVSSVVILDDDHLLINAIYEPTYENPDEVEYMIFEQVPFCSNGKGYTGQRRNSLYLYRISTGEEILLSPKDMDVEHIHLSEDKKKVLAWGPLYKHVKGLYNALIEIDAENKQWTYVLPGDDFTCRWASYFGKKILIIGSYLKKHGVYENVKFFMLEENSLRCITPDLDRRLSNSVGSDCRYGNQGHNNLTFFIDGDSAWFISTDNYRSHLHKVRVDGTIMQMTNELFSIDDYRVHNGKAAVIGMKGLKLQELYIVDKGEERQLTHFNSWVEEECLLSEPVHTMVNNGIEEPIDGWYLKPVNFEEGKKYPAILNIHGGPKTVYGDVFFHEMQYWAGLGYVVFFCNPRGSDGKGNIFDDIRGKYGTIDYDDLMVFTDWIVKNLPFVDSDRIGVTGGSYGGFMANWIIGHTHRFNSAVPQRSISNWISFAGISDIGYYFMPDQQGADIWSDVDKLWWHSPLKYADQVRTPTLFIHSEEDYCCELSQGLQMFTALKRHGVESKICVFKGENHELSRSGRPRQRLARLREITNWFNRFSKKKA